MTELQGNKDNNGEVKQSFTSQRKERKSNSRYRIAILTGIAIVAAIALAGFIVSGGMLPNTNQSNNAPPAPQTTSPTGAILAPGALHGYVTANQETGFTENALISIDGQYLLNNLPAGEYIIMVAYPDGTNEVVNEFQVESGSSHELDFSY